MNREIYFDCSLGQIRAAVMEDGILCELHAERNNEKKLTETVFLGRVEQLRPSVNAAFVNIGQPLNAFLPLAEGEHIRCGDMIIVQGAAKQATECKGLRVTRKINLAGKWLVLIPDADGVHISKKVKDPFLREELMKTAEDIRPTDCGLIVRTASEDVTHQAMQEEVQQLHAQWKSIKKRADSCRLPGVLSESISLDMRLVRDMGNKELTRVITNDPSCLLRLQKEKQEGHIHSQTEISLFDEKNMLLFDLIGIEPQIEKALRKRVWLPSGGYLILDECEALTVIDVNSGKMTLGKDTEDTAVKVNLEAAEEIARQLRLRNAGGMIIVDFIDMMYKENRDSVIERMKSAAKKDRALVKIEGITKLGLLEMTRKRTNATLSKSLQCKCSYCSGTGSLLTPDETAYRSLRQIRRMIIAGQRGPFIVRCAAATANEIMNSRAIPDAKVYVLAVPSKHAERFEIEQIGETDPLPKGAQAI